MHCLIPEYTLRTLGVQQRLQDIKAIKSAAMAAKAKASNKGALKQHHFKILLESSTQILVADESVGMTCNANACSQGECQFI